MPIEFAPPSAQVQPFQIPAPQYTDPLETLYRMQQMRTQNLQQQQAQLGLQQAQMQMDSQKAMLRAFVEGGNDPDKTFQLMGQYGVLPSDQLAYQQHVTTLQTQKAALRKDQQAIFDKDSDIVSGAYKRVAQMDNPTQDDLNAANAELNKLGISPQVHRVTVWPGDKDHMMALANSIGAAGQIDERTLKAAQTTEAQAKTAETQAATQKTGLETETLQDQKFSRALQLAARDPKNPAVVAPDADADLRQRFPGRLPPGPITQDFIDRTTRATVPAAQLPEFDLNNMKLKMGVLGNSEFDQFLVQYARALGKTPAQLTPQEGLASFQQYAEMKQDPVMRNLAIQQKNISEALAKAQLSQIPTQADVEFTARSLLDHSMSPSQFNELRSARTGGSLGLKAFERAKELDPNFSLQRADAEFKSMEKTEEAFTSGREAQMVRSNNNLMEHLGLLDEARKALWTNNFPAMRAVAQALGTAVGSDAKTTYDLIAGKVADEAAKSFIPSGGGEAERLAQANDFASGKGDKQISSNIRAMLNLVDSQQRNLTDQYSRGTYRQMGQQLFTPQALATRDQLLGRQPVQGPEGTTYQHTATGPNGHKIGSNDGKTWYDVQTGQPIMPQTPATRNVQPQEPKPSPLGKPLPSTPSAPTPSGGYFYAERKDGSIARFNSEAEYKKDKREHPELYK